MNESPEIAGADDFEHRFGDDLAGLADALEVVDWAQVRRLAADIRESARIAGWEVVGDIANLFETALVIRERTDFEADHLAFYVRSLEQCHRHKLKRRDGVGKNLVESLDLLTSKLGQLT